MNEKRIDHLFNSGYRANFVITGGGSYALHSLLAVPGASRFVADARIPYSSDALRNVLGREPDHAVSPETAVGMARSVFRPFGSDRMISISCTAALSTDRCRRGADRAYICFKTDKHEKLYSLFFSDSFRRDQEVLLSEWLLSLLAQAVGAETGLILPGSFNPVHTGHFGLLCAAERLSGLRGVFELSSSNMDKPDIPEDEILHRISLIKDVPVALTNAPRFVQKAELFPNSVFVLGYDTVVRLIDYAHHGEWETFRSQKTKFLVAGRICEESKEFYTVNSVEIPESVEDLFEEIPKTLFREDISSTQLRQRADM